MADKADSTPVLALTTADLNTTIAREPRVFDLRLAEVLGFADQHKVRELIRRHSEALQRFGEVSAEQRKPGKAGGRPSTGFWLNKRQALYITAKSDTPRSADITVAMVEIFDSHERGELLTPKRVALPRPHKPKRRSTAPPHLSIDREGLAVMRVGGETVLVDLARLEFGPEERVVCFDAAGELSVEPVRASWPHENWNGRRFGHVRQGRAEQGGISHRGVWAIGAVIATLADPLTKTKPEAKRIAPPARRHPRRFEPGSDLKRDLLLLVRSARDRVAKGRARDLGQALAETLEDLIASEDDPLAPRRGVTLDWNEDRATEDLHAKMRAEGRDPTGLRPREVLH